jgi:hypothetical protein
MITIKGLALSGSWNIYELVSPSLVFTASSKKALPPLSNSHISPLLFIFTFIMTNVIIGLN